MTTLTFASLFSGGGGFDLGAIAAGMAHVWGIELDPQICEVYRTNVGKCLNAAVENISPYELEKVDWLHASPPCPNFSAAKTAAIETAADVSLAQAVCKFIKTQGLRKSRKGDEEASLKLKE